MERPFVVCHMLTSLDGKIDGTFFGVPETIPAIKTYGELRSFYGCLIRHNYHAGGGMPRERWGSYPL